MSVKELVALMDGREMGRAWRDRSGKLEFTYNEEWRAGPQAVPLSLSMPLGLSEHGNKKIEPFLWGLLPDNARVLEEWGRKFHVSPRSAFGLISQVGEDCPGAAQFVPPERVAALQRGTPADIEWLSEKDVASRLRALREDHGAWRLPQDTGQFSLAGAQPKTALLFLKKRWGIPSGRVPTTHILKPPTGEYDGHAENEHFCLELARAAGLPAASSRVQWFQDEVAIVVERYDRVESGAKFIRIHQEDVCQALAILPSDKYENEGGPGVKRIGELLRTYSSSAEEDLATFVDAIAFNWLIAGTDAHAKNYSLLLGAEGQTRLAPLYDLASLLPYPQFNAHKTRLAMKLGGEYRLKYITRRNWEALAKEVRLPVEEVIGKVRELAREIADLAAETASRVKQEGLKHQIIGKLKDGIAERAGECAKLLSS